MKRLLPIVLVLTAAAAGCGGQDTGKGRAALWVTRDRGAHVLLVRAVPAGLTAMQALDREAKIETRYGGRYVQSIAGIEGSLSGRSDWFYFVNGIEGDRSAAEYRLHPGDVEWWDYRSWERQMRQPVVVGAFPEPFLHGYGGRRQLTWVVYTKPSYETAARRLASLVHGRAGATAGHDANVINVVPGNRFDARMGGSPRDPVLADIGIQAAIRLIHRPSAFRFRYEVP